MKAILLTLSTAIAAALVASGAPAASETGPLRAGSAKIEVTPPVGALNPGDTIRDPLYARAIVISNGTSCAVLVGLDQGGARDTVVLPAIARAAKSTGCAPENFVISATHTHSGSTGGLGGAGEPNAKRLEDAIVGAIDQANARLRPARLGYATTHVDLNVNRDWFINNRWVQGPNPLGVSDKTLAVIDVIDAKGIPIGVYMNYAMHPVNFYLTGVISADFPGEASRYIEHTYGPDTVAIFVQGASGNQNPRLNRATQKLSRTRTHNAQAANNDVTTLPAWMLPERRNGVTESTKALDTPISVAELPAYNAAIQNAGAIVSAEGAIIAESALQAIREETARVDRASIGGATETFQCAGRDRLDRDDPVRENALPPYADGAPVNIKVGVLRIGDIYISTVNGEVYNDIALRLKHEAPVSKLMMTTLANGAANSGYIYSNEAGSHLTFQVIGSRLKPNCAEDKIVNTGLELITRAQK